MKWIVLFGKVTLTLVVAMVGVLLFSMALFPWFSPESSPVPLILAQEVAFISAALLSWRWLERRPLREMGFSAPDPIRSFGEGCLIGILLIGAVFLLLWVTPWLEVSDARWTSEVTWAALTALLAFFMVAVGEEVFTRGYLQTLLVSRIGPRGGILVTSLIFAGLHGANPHTGTLPLLNLFLAGVLLGTVRYVSGNLWAPTGLHLTWNWTQEMLSLPVSGIHLTTAPPVRSLETGPDWITGGPFGLEGGVAVTLAITAGTVLYRQLGRSRSGDPRFTERTMR